MKSNTMKKINFTMVIGLIGLVVVISSCKSSTTAATVTTTTTTSGGTSGGTTGLTNDSLVGTWTGSCTSFTPTVTGSGAAYHQLTFISTSSGSFVYYDNWYTGPSCGGGTWVLQLQTGGTYAIGSLASGSSIVYNIVYTTDGTASVIDAFGQNEPISYNGGSGAVTTIHAWLQTYGCNGGGSFVSDGQPYAENGIGCGLGQMPGTGTSVYNVIEISGNTMTIGAIATNYISPGVLSTGAVAGTPTITLDK
jgi:hypothetical protein